MTSSTSWPLLPTTLLYSTRSCLPIETFTWVFCLPSTCPRSLSYLQSTYVSPTSSLVVGYCKYPLSLVHHCHCVCLSANTTFARTRCPILMKLRVFFDTLVVRNAKFPLPLVLIKFNNNRHFGPIDQLCGARICKWHVLKICENFSCIHLCWIFCLWPENVRDQIKNVGGNGFGAVVPTIPNVYNNKKPS